MIRHCGDSHSKPAFSGHKAFGVSIVLRPRDVCRTISDSTPILAPIMQDDQRHCSQSGVETHPHVCYCFITAAIESIMTLSGGAVKLMILDYPCFGAV